jgi:hypothetical protein
VNLFNKLKRYELNQVISNLSLSKHTATRDQIAHFCEHDGIFIRFTRARKSWHAMAPCALKPWWLFLDPLKKQEKQLR